MGDVGKEVNREIPKGCSNHLATIGKCWRHETEASDKGQLGASEVFKAHWLLMSAQLVRTPLMWF